LPEQTIDHSLKQPAKVQGEPMKYYFIPLLLFVCFAHPSFAGPLPDVPHIVVTGEYELRATPDILTLSLSIAETGFEVAAARDSIETRSKKLIRSLETLDIAKEDISSAQLQITPHYNWNNNAQIYAGTEVSRIVEVTLRDLSRYDDLIRSIIDAGVAQIHSTSLSSSQEKKLREEALRGAIADGMEKAKIMVAHLPQQIGPVYSISPQSSNAPFQDARFAMAEMGKQSAFEPGTILFKESLQLVFYLVKEK
jgi:hypothetical protein